MTGQELGRYENKAFIPPRKFSFLHTIFIFLYSKD